MDNYHREMDIVRKKQDRFYHTNNSTSNVDHINLDLESLKSNDWRNYQQTMDQVKPKKDRLLS